MNKTLTINLPFDPEYIVAYGENDEKWVWASDNPDKEAIACADLHDISIDNPFLYAAIECLRETGMKDTEVLYQIKKQVESNKRY